MTALAAFVPFVLIPAVVGSAITLVLVHVFPARRTRDILSVVAVLTAGAVVVVLRLARPERFARRDGMHTLVDYLAEMDEVCSGD